MDFKKATELFADPDFDGDPVQIYEPGTGDPPNPPDPPPGGDDGEDEGDDWDDGDSGGDVLIGPPIDEPGRPRKYVVGDVEVSVIAERVQYYGKDGKLITESLKDYTRKTIQQEFESLDTFLKTWTEAEKKEVIIKELEDQGVLFEPLKEEIGKDYDPFDLICHVVYDQPPLTRKERAENVRKRNYFAKYGEQAKEILNALLDKYADVGIEHIETMNVLKVQPINELGTPLEIVKMFGGRDKYLEAIRELESQLYSVA